MLLGSFGTSGSAHMACPGRRMERVPGLAARQTAVAMAQSESVQHIPSVKFPQVLLKYSLHPTSPVFNPSSPQLTPRAEGRPLQAGFYFSINTLVTAWVLQESLPASPAQEITSVPSNLNLQLVGKEPKDTNALSQTRCSQDLEGEGQSLG